MVQCPTTRAFIGSHSGGTGGARLFAGLMTPSHLFFLTTADRNGMERITYTVWHGPQCVMTTTDEVEVPSQASARERALGYAVEYGLANGFEAVIKGEGREFRTEIRNEVKVSSYARQVLIWEV